MKLQQWKKSVPAHRRLKFVMSCNNDTSFYTRIFFSLVLNSMGEKYFICVRACVIALSCIFVSSVISIQRKSMKVISLFLATHGKQTIYIFFDDGSYIYSSAYCIFRQRTCSFSIDAQRANILVTRALCTSLRIEIFAMQVCIAVEVSQYIPQDGFLNSALWILCHNSALLSISHQSEQMRI